MHTWEYRRVLFYTSPSLKRKPYRPGTPVTSHLPIVNRNKINDHEQPQPTVFPPLFIDYRPGSEPANQIDNLTCEHRASILPQPGKTREMLGPSFVGQSGPISTELSPINRSSGHRSFDFHKQAQGIRPARFQTSQPTPETGFNTYRELWPTRVPTRMLNVRLHGKPELIDRVY